MIIPFFESGGYSIVLFIFPATIAIHFVALLLIAFQYWSLERDDAKMYLLTALIFPLFAFGSCMGIAGLYTIFQ